MHKLVATINGKEIKFDNKKDAHKVTLAAQTGVVYLTNTNSSWISSTGTGPYYCVDAVAPKPLVEVKLTEPKICDCCGAKIHGTKCEYCGVEYNYKEVKR